MMIMMLLQEGNGSVAAVTPGLPRKARRKGNNLGLSSSSIDGAASLPSDDSSVASEESSEGLVASYHVTSES